MATYAQIVARVKQYTIDNEGPLVAVVDPLIDDIIDRAERRIEKDLELDAMLQTQQQALAMGEYWLDKPADLLGVDQLMLHPAAGDPITLAYRTRTWVDLVYPVLEEAGAPRLYCSFDESFWRIAPALDAAYTAELVYRKRIGGLSLNTTTTWLSINLEELLFKAILAECEALHRNFEVKAQFDKDYDAELKRAQIEAARLRRDGGRLS